MLRMLSSVAAMAPTAMAPPAGMAPATGALLQVFPWAAVSPRAGSYMPVISEVEADYGPVQYRGERARIVQRRTSDA